MNIAIIGSEGRMGKFHAKHAAKYGTVLGIDTILRQSDEEVESLLEAADVAIVATPTDTHHAWADNLIARGIPLLIEKPLASSLTQAAAIITAANFNHVPVHVGYLNRFNPAWHQFAANIDGEGRFWASRSGRLVGREYGGVGLDLATHDIDLVYQRWPDAIIKPTIKTMQVYQLEVFVPSANVSGRITARYVPKAKAPNIREWTWAGSDGYMLYADLTRQFTLERNRDRKDHAGDQVDEQLQHWLLGGKGVATVEEAYRNMAVLL